jgi:hypothetical protein
VPRRLSSNTLKSATGNLAAIRGVAEIHHPGGLDAALAPAEPAGLPRLERFLDAIHTYRQKKAV